MLTSASWADIVVMRLARNPFVNLTSEEQREWLTDLIEEIQNDALPVKGNA
jgi:hypothetical protein